MRGYSLLPMEGGAPKGRRLDGDSGISETKPSPRGEGGERSEPDRVLAGRKTVETNGKCVSSRRYTRAPYPPLTRSPFPNGEGYDTRIPLFSTQRFSQWGNAKRRRPCRQKKESQPRLAALGSPFQGKGLAWTLPPSYGRRCPEGAEVGWGKRYPRHKAFPAWGRWRAERAG